MQTSVKMTGLRDFVKQKQICSYIESSRPYILQLYVILHLYLQKCQYYDYMVTIKTNKYGSFKSITLDVIYCILIICKG